MFGDSCTAQHRSDTMRECHAQADIAKNQAQQRPAEEPKAAQTTATGELELLNVTLPG